MRDSDCSQEKALRRFSLLPFSSHEKKGRRLCRGAFVAQRYLAGDRSPLPGLTCCPASPGKGEAGPQKNFVFFL